MGEDEKEVYTEWLAAAPKGVKWDRAQEMWEEYNRKRKKQAEVVAKRLLGQKVCPACRQSELVYMCSRCGDTGWVNG